MTATLPAPLVVRCLWLAAAVCGAAGTPPAQPPMTPRGATAVSRQVVLVGDVSGTVGCQQPTLTPPRLSDGTKASGALEFSYDEQTHVLTVVATNTSEVTAGVANPVITQIAFNLPLGAVVGAQLLSQTALAGATPGFRLQVDPSSSPQLGMGCLGSFSVRLLTTASGGAIGNPAAGTFGVPTNTVALGARFDIALSGPGIDFITARTIALGYSQNATLQPVIGACRFDAGGPTATGQGYISAVEDPNAPGATQSQPTIWITAHPVQLPTQTNRFQLCVGAQPGLHGCLLGSPQPGPYTMNGITLPIGMPVAAVAIAVMPPTGRQCFGVQIPPPPPNLVGVTSYWVFVTAVPISAEIPLRVEYSPRFDLKIE